MTTQEKIALIRELQAAVQGGYDSTQLLFDVFGVNPYGPFQDAIYKLMDYAYKATAVATGDTSGWIEWFGMECEWGKYPYAAGYDGKIREIRTVEDLVELIEK